MYAALAGALALFIGLGAGIAGFVMSRRPAKAGPRPVGGILLMVLGGLLVVACLPIACTTYMWPYTFPEHSLDAVAQRGDEIVDAIRRYESERGQPPATLEALVPVYLPGIPATGFRGDAEWEYLCSDGGWTLCAAVNSPLLLDFDEFRYSPDREPDAGYRLIVRRGAWLFLDD